MMVPIDDDTLLALRHRHEAAIRNWQMDSDALRRAAFGPGTRNTGLGGGAQTAHPVRRTTTTCIDRDDQRSDSYTGIHGIAQQDMAVTESMGDIYDRTHEHLGTSDKAIIRMRRMLIKAARDLAKGIEPPGLDPNGPWAGTIRTARHNGRPDISPGATPTNGGVTHPLHRVRPGDTRPSLGPRRRRTGQGGHSGHGGGPFTTGRTAVARRGVGGPAVPRVA